MRKENRSPRVKVKIKRGQFYVYKHLPYIPSFLFTRVNKEEEETGLTYNHFEKSCRKKMCTRQSRMAIWDMINTLFLTTVAVEPTFVAFFSTSKRMSMASRAILSNFFEEQ